VDLDALKAARQKGLQKLLPDRPRVAVGLATCGIAAGGDRVYAALEAAIRDRGLDMELAKVGCIGYCREEPLVNIQIPGKPCVILHRVTEADAEEIVRAVAAGDVPRRLALCRVETWDPLVGEKLDFGTGFDDIPAYADIPYFAPQRKIVLRDAGFINPEDIDEYFAVGGYRALYKALTEMTPEAVIDEVIASGLRGRGGAGFPTGTKWNFTKVEKSLRKYIICNADEGDPGAYMNRNEMESDPHMILEGMLIGAYAIGAREGIIYVRAEYPLAIARLTRAMEEARAHGLLGKNIFGTDFSFELTLAEGAGAFVCGEETALIASIEGKTGRPRPRPPFPAQKGLWGMPTNINNVETWTNIPVIISRGGDWFAGIGAEKNTGTKVYSLVGEVQRVGLVEVPLGTPIRTLVYDVGNGGIDGRDIKAVQTGGPSGGCIPASLFDTPMDYEHLTAVGSIMGSGGVVVMDETTSMVDTARFFIGFTHEESCGKCAPCREGLKHMLMILDKILSGKATRENLDLLEELSGTIKKTSLCGLGQTAPNPVLTTLKYFRNEYDATLKGAK